MQHMEQGNLRLHLHRCQCCWPHQLRWQIQTEQRHLFHVCQPCFTGRMADLTVHLPVKCPQNPETLMDSERLVDPRRTRSPGIYCHAVARIARCSSIKCCSDLHPEGHTTGTATWQVLAFSMHLAHTSLPTSTTSTTCYLFFQAKADWSHSDLRVHCCTRSQQSSWQLHQ